MYIPNSNGNEETPPTPTGTEGELTPKETTPPVETPPVGDVDYKTKFGASAAENQRIMLENKQLAQEKAELEVQLEQSNEVLSEKELEDSIPDFALLDTAEQNAEKLKLKDKKRIATLEAKQKWNDDYAKMVPDLTPEMRKALEDLGGEYAFKKFACSPENAGQINLLNLAKQFLFDSIPTIPEDLTPADPITVTPGLEDGSGGEHLPPLPPKKGYTAKEASDLRKNKPQVYQKLVQEKKMTII